MASRNAHCVPQQNLLLQQNSPGLDKALLYLQGHISELEFRTFQDTLAHKIKGINLCCQRLQKNTMFQ